MGLFDGSVAVDGDIFFLPFVEVGHGLGLGVVYLYSVADDAFVGIVGSVAALRPEQDPLHEYLFGHHEFYHCVDLQVVPFHYFVEGPGLGDGSGEAVEDVAGVVVDYVFDYFRYQTVGRELATTDGVAQGEADGGFGGYFAADDFACGDVVEAELRGDQAGLCPFSGSRGTEEYDVGHWLKNFLQIYYFCRYEKTY